MARPLSFSGTSSSGTATHYQVQAFHVSVTSTYVFEINGVTHPDTYALVYGGSFDPNNPLTNLLNGDDDYSGAFSLLGGSGQGFASSRIAPGEGSNFDAGAGVVFNAGVNYYAVVTGFGNNDAGTYNAAIGGGQGDVIAGAVPEPASMVILGLGALAALRRKKAAK